MVAVLLLGLLLIPVSYFAFGSEDEVFTSELSGGALVGLDDGDTNEGLDPELQKNTPSVKSIITELEKWKINKTGNEINLDVNYTIISDNTTEFCIGFNDKSFYETELSLTAKDITQIPITKLIGDAKVIVQDKIDLSKATKIVNKCFNITYDILENISFKLGWDSVQIDSTADDYAMIFEWNDNLVYTSDGWLQTLYIGNGDVTEYYKSNDNGTTWIDNGTPSGSTTLATGIITQDNGSSYWYADVGNIEVAYGGINGWTEISSDAFDGNTGYPSGAMDSNNVGHFVSTLSDIAYYTTTDTLGTKIAAMGNSTVDADFCDIEIDDDNYPWIVCLGKTSDDLYIVSNNPTTEGWGKPIKVVGGNIVQDGPTISIRDNLILLVWNGGVISSQVCLGNTTHPYNWTCQQLNPVAYYSQAEAVYNGEIVVFIGTDNPLDDGNIKYSNTTIQNIRAGINWSRMTNTDDDGQYFSIQDSNWPRSNRLNSQINYVFADNADVYYSYLDIPSPPTPTINVFNPTTVQTVDVKNGTNLTINFTLEYISQNRTTGVSINNITTDGIIAPIKQILGCTGTLDCSANAIEATCNNCSQCNWTVAATDATPRTCSGVWGASCEGIDPGLGDYSFDGCASGGYYSSGGFLVNEVTVNATTVIIGNMVNISCIFDCHVGSVNNDLAISYYNGSWHQVWRQDASCVDGEYSKVIQISGELGQQKARCQIGYVPSNPLGTCFTVNYADNDDVDFTVVASESCNSIESGACGSCNLDDCDTNCSDAGCSVDYIKEFGYTDPFWQVNVTMPGVNMGLRNITVNATYNEIRVFSTETYAVNYTGIPIPSYPNITFEDFTPDNNTNFGLNYSANFNMTVHAWNMTQLIFSFNNSNFTIIDDRLKFYLSMDNLTYLGEYEGYAKDTSLLKGNATNETGAIYVNKSGKFGSAWDFKDDNSDAVTNNIGIDGNDLVTISAWFFPTANETGQENRAPLFTLGDEQGSKYGSTILETKSAECSGNPVGVHFYSANLCGTNKLSDLGINQWHNMIYTNDGTTQSLYVDGVLEGTSAFTINVKAGPSHICSRDGNTDDFDGLIDEIMVWNYSMSSDNVLRMYGTQLQRLNQSYWTYSMNYTNIIAGTYTYYGYVSNSTNSGKTGTRTLISERDVTSPSLTFVSPSPTNKADIGATETINVSSTENVSECLLNWTYYDGAKSGNNLANDSRSSISGEGDTSASGALTTLIDEDTNTGYSEGSNTNTNITIVLTEDKQVESVKVYWGTFWTFAYGTVYNFSYWNDTHWVTPTEWAESANTAQGSYVTYTLGTPVITDRIKLRVIQDSNGQNGGSWDLMEYQIIEGQEALTNSYNMTVSNDNAGTYANFTISGLTESETYYYYAYCNDSQNNWGLTSTQQNTYPDTTYPIISFIDNTPINNTISPNATLDVNVSVTETNLDTLVYNWNGTNYSFYDSALKLLLNFDNRSALGENSTVCKDSSLQDNTCLIDGAFANLTGKYFGALSFDGSSDMVNVSGIPSSPASITQAAWIKTTSDNDVVMSKRQSSQDGSDWATILVDSNGFANIVVDDAGYANYIISTTTVNDGEWHWVVGVKEGTNYTIYVDGVGESSETDAHAMGGGSDTFTIGWNGAWKRYFKGEIDEVQVWTRALSNDEIMELYSHNIYKYDTDKYLLTISKDISSGTYTYFACVNDTFTNMNCTEERTFVSTRDQTAPIINYTAPTPDNATGVFTGPTINVTSNENVSWCNLTWEFLGSTDSNENIANTSASSITATGSSIGTGALGDLLDLSTATGIGEGSFSNTFITINFSSLKYVKSASLFWGQFYTWSYGTIYNISYWDGSTYITPTEWYEASNSAQNSFIDYDLTTQVSTSSVKLSVFQDAFGGSGGYFDLMSFNITEGISVNTTVYEMTINNFDAGTYANFTVPMTLSDTTTYTYSVTCEDTSPDANSASTNEREVTADSSPPVFSDLVNGSEEFGRYQNFSANFTVTDGVQLDWAWIETNASGSWVNYSFTETSESSIRLNSSFNITSPKGNLTCWRGFANDSLGQVNNSVTTCFETMAQPRILINLVSPKTNISVDTNLFFNFIVNVTCLNDDCGQVNVSLDPITWWSYDWDYKQQISVSVAAGSTSTDYQTKLRLNSTNVGANFNWGDACNDLRFLNGSEDALLDYYIENCNGTAQNATVWVKVDKNITTEPASIFMYYGNDAVNNLSNGTATFEFFDDATGNYSHKWTSIEGTGNYSVVGGKQAVSLSSSTTNIRTLTYQMNGSFAVEADMYETDVIAAIQYYQDTTPSTNERYHARVDVRGGSTEVILEGGSGTGLDVFSEASTWVKTKLTRDQTGNHSWYVNGSLADLLTGETTYTTGYISLNHHNAGTGAVANMKVSKFHSPEPTYSMLEELSGDGKNGLVSTVPGDTPFYTTTRNPFNLTLKAGESSLVTWALNATGTINNTYEFFAYANKTDQPTISNYTGKLNVTIRNVSADSCTAPVSGHWSVIHNCFWNAPQTVPSTWSVTGGVNCTLNSTFTIANKSVNRYVEHGSQLFAMRTGVMV